MIQFRDCAPAADPSAEAAGDPFYMPSAPGFDTAPRPPTWNARANYQGFLPGAAVSELEASTMSGYGAEFVGGPTPVAPHPFTFVFLLAIGWAMFGR